MAKISRPKSRRYLFQSLYARSTGAGEMDAGTFEASFFESEYVESLDRPYIDDAYHGVIERQSLLLNILERYAPRFAMESIPRANLVIACLALYEMFFLRIDTIPEKVVINEALELAKTYSDPAFKTLLNGVLNAAKNDRETILSSQETLIRKPYTFLFADHVAETAPSES
ncbi:MAG TPA: transcription antitermination protein NusB [bacterium]|nr:transcription antitermination protein NusB [bacterium]